MISAVAYLLSEAIWALIHWIGGPVDTMPPR